MMTRMKKMKNQMRKTNIKIMNQRVIIPVVKVKNIIRRIKKKFKLINYNHKQNLNKNKLLNSKILKILIMALRKKRKKKFKKRNNNKNNNKSK